MIDVCICTYNPREDLLAKVLQSILKQTVGGDVFRLLIVDNASSPPLEESLLDQFSTYGISARIVREVNPGIARARLRAMQETTSEWLLFVDDDNELMPDYIVEGVDFLSANANVGCFGGKLLLAPDLSPPSWLVPFLPYLAIKDEGEAPVFGKANVWGRWEPPTAGAFIRRSVLNLYMKRAESDEKIFSLGRKGKNNLSSCEDSLIMRGAFSLDLMNAYNHRMVLYHHLDVKRFRLKYVIRLMHAYGVSHVTLESLLDGSHEIPIHYVSRRQFVNVLWSSFSGGLKQSLAFGVGMVAYHLGARSEYLRNYD